MAFVFTCAGASSHTSRGASVHSAAESRKLDHNPCGTASDHQPKRRPPSGHWSGCPELTEEAIRGNALNGGSLPLTKEPLWMRKQPTGPLRN